MTKKSTNSRAFTFRLTDTNREMLEDIMGRRGYPTMAATISQAIIEMHYGVFKHDAPSQIRRTKTVQERAQEVSEDAAKGKPAKVDAALKKQYDICEELGGTIVEKGGVAQCHYYTYEATPLGQLNKYLQEVEIGGLTEAMVKVQYSPSKEKVESLLAQTN